MNISHSPGLELQARQHHKYMLQGSCIYICMHTHFQEHYYHFLDSNTILTTEKEKEKSDRFSGQSHSSFSLFLSTAGGHMTMTHLHSISNFHFTSCTKVTRPGHDVTGIVNLSNEVFYIHGGVHKQQKLIETLQEIISKTFKTVVEAFMNGHLLTLQMQLPFETILEQKDLSVTQLSSHRYHNSFTHE